MGMDCLGNPLVSGDGAFIGHEVEPDMGQTIPVNYTPPMTIIPAPPFALSA